MSKGSEFQIVGAATEKLLEPKAKTCADMRYRHVFRSRQWPERNCFKCGTDWPPR